MSVFLNCEFLIGDIIHFLFVYWLIFFRFLILFSPETVSPAVPVSRRRMTEDNEVICEIYERIGVRP